MHVCSTGYHVHQYTTSDRVPTVGAVLESIKLSLWLGTGVIVS